MLKINNRLSSKKLKINKNNKWQNRIKIVINKLIQICLLIIIIKITKQINFKIL